MTTTIALDELSVAETTAARIVEKPRNYIPQLDGLRAFAVSFVLVAHGLYSEIPSLKKITDYGSTGILLFFIISGFLISRILIRSKGSPNYFFNFYARRGLRIWPLYYAVLALSFALLKFGPPQPSMTTEIHVWVYLTYLQNLIYGHQPVPVGLSPTWTLAVEEQFYLTWPLIVYFSSRKTLRWLCLALMIAAPIIRFWDHFDSWNTLCQLDALALGALLACEGYDPERLLRICRYAVLLFPLGMLLHASGIAWIDRWFNGNLFEIYGGAALVYLTMQTSTAAASIFANSLLRYIGKISYGIYLFNVPVFAALGYVLKGIRHSPSITTHIIFLLIGSAMTIGVAALSYSLFESPLLRLKKYFPE
jgi:peptidoglycan/LPS O-acetylase OafA/YrhL